jgi:hypothetical protein
LKPDKIFSFRHVAARFMIPAMVLAGTTITWASDLEREQRLADQIVDAILDGDPVTLAADGHEFLGIYTQAETDVPLGGAIILHGRGTHPDWSQVAGPLRTALPAHGWTTLSLQMPVLGKDASYYDYVPIFPEAIPRIEAGIRYLHGQDIKRIVLIAHSCGVHMSMAWLEQQGDAQLAAYIGIGMGATDYQQPMRKPLPIGRLQVPFLNIYGSNDYPAVQRQAEAFELILDGRDDYSTQIQVPGADHYFSDFENELVEVIANWLGGLVRPDR